jgi:hypothetical protein
VDDDTSGVLVYNFNKGPNDPIHCRPIALATALTYLSIYLATFACVFAVQVGVRAWGATLRAAPVVLTAACIMYMITSNTFLFGPKKNVIR